MAPGMPGAVAWAAGVVTHSTCGTHAPLIATWRMSGCCPGAQLTSIGEPGWAPCCPTAASAVPGASPVRQAASEPTAASESPAAVKSLSER